MNRTELGLVRGMMSDGARRLTPVIAVKLPLP